MQIQSIEFKRDEFSEWEKGLIIHNEGAENNLIVDEKAIAVDQSVWDINYNMRLIVSY